MVALGERERASIRDVKESIMDTLTGGSGKLSKEYQLAVLAELVDEFLTEYRDSTVKKQPKNSARRRDGSA